MLTKQTLRNKALSYYAPLRGPSEEHLNPSSLLDFGFWKNRQLLKGNLPASFLFMAMVLFSPFRETRAQNCPAPTFTFSSPSLQSGSAGAENAVYRFDDVLPGVDALLTIVNKSHSDIIIQSLDEPAATNGGYDWAFQPIIDYHWYNGDGTSDPPGDRHVTFQFDFVSANTTNPVDVALMHMTAVDVDGNGVDLREFVETSAYQSYELQSPTELSLSTSGDLRATGDYPAHDGVEETALSTMISYVFEDKSSVTVTYGATMNGVADEFTAEERLNCLYFKCYNFNTTVDCAVISTVGSATICEGAGTTVNATASGGVQPYTYAWSHGLGNGQSKNVSPSSTTTYTVTATDSGGCENTSQVTVTVNAAPTANAGNDESLCRFFNTMLSASVSGGTAPYTYSWSNAPGAGNDLVVAPMNTTTYTVTVTSDNGCIDTDDITVTVNQCAEICNNGVDDDGDGLADCADPDCGPSVDLGLDVNACVGSEVILTAETTGGGGGTLTLAWDNGLGSGNDKTISANATTTYNVTVTSPSGCTATDQITVNVVNCAEDCYNGIDDDGDGLIDCADPDCLATAAPQLVADSYTTCPGLPYTERVTYNDGNLQNPSFSIVGQPMSGMVSIDQTGKFTYTPFNFECHSDGFVYQVCNQLSGCCATANVDITFGDVTAPVLTNVPADLTISCDDMVPDAPTVIGFDECPGLYITFDENSNLNSNGACENYNITRTWTAEDLCGNDVSQTQTISVVDLTQPEIFQVYTLENGKRVVAGVAQRSSNQWKYIPFPITFGSAPVIFTQVTTNNDMAGVTVRQRNASTQGFEIMLSEEEAADGLHSIENVSWIAFEPGSLDGNMTYEAGTFANLTHSAANLAFDQNYGGAPALFTTLTTAKEMDAVVPRLTSLSATAADIYLQEETSADAETDHANENLGYLACEAAQPMMDKVGNDFGETGRITVANAWATVSFGGAYTKPVVVCSGISNQDGEPVEVRVRNVTSGGFEVRLQEWDYLDGNHATETLSWMVVEGSISGDKGYYCSGKANHLLPNINVFAMDNCDNLAQFDYSETSSMTNTGLLTTRTWSAQDDCGNLTELIRYDTCVVAAVKAKALLYGAAMDNGGNGLMRDDLRKKSLVPIEEPYSQLSGFTHVDYVHVDNGNSNEQMVTICVDPGAAGESTIDVPLSQLSVYLNGGASIGACGTNPNGMVTICHKPGTPAEKTKVIPQSALMGHLGHGDFIGSCSGGGSDIPAGAVNPDYRTVADGNWSDGATWEGGNVPPFTNINNKTISIEHNVTIQNSNLHLKNNSELFMTHGSLTMVNGYFEIGKSQVYFTGSVFEGSTAGSVRLTNSQSVLSFADCNVKIGQYLENNGGLLRMEDVCLEVSEYFENNGGIDSLINVCAIIQGDIKNNSLGRLHAEKVRFHLPNGDFVNALGAELTGNDLIIFSEIGTLDNLGSWLAPLTQHCVAGGITGLGGILLPAEDCLDISNYFSPCTCEHADGTNTGGGNSNTGGTTVNTEGVNAGNSAGNGEMNPVLLTVEGNDAVVDWVLIEIRDAVDPRIIVGYATVEMQRDGDLMTEDGEDVIVFPGLPEENYYVAVRHRNHLALMTETPVYLSTNNIPTLDFTDIGFNVQGGPTAGRIYNGKRYLWGGDYNEDGRTIYQGPNNDIFSLFSRVLGHENNSEYLANYIVDAYDLNDMNLDGRVIFQGPNNDKAPVLYHAVLSHPGNFSFLANYIVSEVLP